MLSEEQPAPSGWKPFVFRHSSLIITLIVFAGLFLPFVNKAFHIDDRYFLNMSDMLGWNPLISSPQDINYQGRTLFQALPYESTHPLLVPYLLKIGVALFGDKEIPLHLMFLVFPVMSLWFLWRIGRNIMPASSGRNILLTLLFCSMPAFLVNAQNLMTDVVSLCFLLGAISYFIESDGRQNLQPVILGSICLTLSIFTSYQSLAFIPLLVLYVLADRGLKRYRLASLSAPAVILVIWLALIYYIYGLFPLLSTKIEVGIGSEMSRGLSLSAFGGKGVYVLATTGLMTLFPLAFHISEHRKIRSTLIILPVLVIISFGLVTPFENYSILERGGLAILMACGVLGLSVCIFTVFKEFANSSDRAINLLLGGWIVIVVGYNIVLMPFGAARYLLPLFPPMYLLLLKTPDKNKKVKLNPIVSGFLLAGSIIFGLVTAISDYNYAGSYREAAIEVEKVKSIIGENHNIWYVGEWGMRHYFDKIGARYLLANSHEPSPGDYIVIPEMPRYWVPAQQVQIRTKMDGVKEYSSSIPVRLFNRRSNSGFYCHLWGLLPMAISTEPDEIFILMKVVR